LVFFEIPKPIPEKILKILGIISFFGNVFKTLRKPSMGIVYTMKNKSQPTHFLVRKPVDSQFTLKFVVTGLVSTLKN